MLATYLTKIFKSQKEKQEALTNVQDFISFKISHYSLSHSATPNLGHLHED